MKTFFIEQQYETEVFERCHRLGLPLLLRGPTGCGKTQLVEFMAEKLRIPLVKVACNEDTSSADLLGRFLLRGGETVWQDGPVSRAVRTGALLYLDEIAEAREDVIVALHPLTDQRREIYLDKTNEVLRAPASFLCVASYNPHYQRGLKEMKPSTLQRFVHLPMWHLPPDKEAGVLKQLCEIPDATCHKLVLFADRVRKSKDLQLKETVSTRLLVHAGRLIADGMNPRRACHQAVGYALSDDDTTSTALNDLIDLSL